MRIKNKMKNHLKRIPSPRTWLIDRKENTFITRPKPGAHSMESSLPLGVILRDFIKYASTTREAKKLLNSKEVLIDGKRKKDHRLPVGIFDVISFPSLKKDFRVVLDKKGRIMIKEISSIESKIKPCKIVGKTMLSKKLQLNLHDGRSVLVEKDFKCKVNDTVLIELPTQKVKEVFELKEGALVYLIKGKRSSDSGVLKEIKGDDVVYQKDNQDIEAPKKYVFILGNKKPCVDVSFDNVEVEEKKEEAPKKEEVKEEKKEDKVEGNEEK